MSPAPRRGRSFAATWWGQAWVTALESSTLDAGRLSRGRTYARKGMVGETTVKAGAVQAPVQGSRPRPYRTAVRLATLTDRQWTVLLDTIAARAGHVAALLDGDMPHELVEDAGTAGVPLLPWPTELRPECSCPDWGHPCKHAAALCYAVAATLDDDPFLLFTLRGKSKKVVLEELRRRRARPGTTAAAAPAAPAGVPASAAYTRWSTGEHPDLPVPEPGPATTRPVPLPVDPPPASGLTARGLELLAADAATRAAALLAGDDSTLYLTARQDAVRLAATHRHVDWFENITESTGLRPLDLARLARAWRYGGPGGLGAAESPHTPDPAAIAAARTALADALRDLDQDQDGPAPRLRAWRNRLTLDGHDLQLRLGEDRRWHPYVKDGADWWPCAPADPDPVAALAAALDARNEAARREPH